MCLISFWIMLDRMKGDSWALAEIFALLITILALEESKRNFWKKFFTQLNSMLLYF